MSEVSDALAERTAEVQRLNRRLQQLYLQMDQETELARRIQHGLLPRELPEVPGVRFAVHYRPCGRVGGDFYDAFRLDESHLGFYVADVMGHGVPASLLTVFVKKGVQAKEVFGSRYHLVAPGEVLRRLNRDLLGHELADSPFITLAYALLNHRDGTLRLARAGHPYPLYVPRHGAPALLRSEGLLLGVCDAHFAEHTLRLAPGDKLLLYSDGIDAARFEDHPAGLGRGGVTPPLLACAERHRSLPIQEFVQTLALDLFRAAGPADDLTLLGLEMAED